MIAANATTSHLPRTAGRIGFAQAAMTLGGSRVELASTTSHLQPGQKPRACGYEDRQGSPGPGDA